MTTWTDKDTTATTWTSKTKNDDAVIIYNDVNINYNLDYITYNGSYVLGNTDWEDVSATSTIWT